MVIPLSDYEFGRRSTLDPLTVRDLISPQNRAVAFTTKAPPLKRRQSGSDFNMADTLNDIERDALEMIEQYGGAAVRIARVRAEIAEKNLRNHRLAQNWHVIADAIEIILTKP